MKIERVRISRYLLEIENCRSELEELAKGGLLKPGTSLMTTIFDLALNVPNQE